MEGYADKQNSRICQQSDGFLEQVITNYGQVILNAFRGIMSIQPINQNQRDLLENSITKLVQEVISLTGCKQQLQLHYEKKRSLTNPFDDFSSNHIENPSKRKNEARPKSPAPQRNADKSNYPLISDHLKELARDLRSAIPRSFLKTKNLNNSVNPFENTQDQLLTIQTKPLLSIINSSEAAIKAIKQYQDKLKRKEEAKAELSAQLETKILKHLTTRRTHINKAIQVGDGGLTYLSQTPQYKEQSSKQISQSIIPGKTSQFLKTGKVGIEIVHLDNHKKETILGGDLTFLAVKNAASYLIGTTRFGITLIEDTLELYSQKMPLRNAAKIMDMVYVGLKNCYLMCYDNKLYRKDVNRSDPYLFIDIKFGLCVSKAMKWAQNAKRIILNTLQQLSIVNLDTKSLELWILPTSSKGKIADFDVFGLLQNRAIILTIDGCVSAERFSLSKRTTKSLGTFKINLLKGRRESGASIAVGSLGKYCCVLIRGVKSNSYVTSRYLMFELTKTGIVLNTIFDRSWELDLGLQIAFSRFGYVAGKLIFLGLSINKRLHNSDDVFVISFDPKDGEEKGEIKLVGRRELQGGSKSQVVSLVKNGVNVYVCDKEANLYLIKLQV